LFAKQLMHYTYTRTSIEQPNRRWLNHWMPIRHHNSIDSKPD